MNNKVNKVINVLEPLMSKHETLRKATTLHHFGQFNKSEHTLSLPIWVSDNYKEAKEYENFGIKAPYYSVFETNKDLCLFDLNGARLSEIAISVGVNNHTEWNQVLSKALQALSVPAIVYAGREIFIGSPVDVLTPISSETTNA